jgi:hypothetical protein
MAGMLDLAEALQFAENCFDEEATQKVAQKGGIYGLPRIARKNSLATKRLLRPYVRPWS